MQREFRDGRSHGQHAYIGTVPSHLRIARKGAGDHVENETCAHAVPDQDDFIESALARAREQEVGELIDPRVDIGATVVNHLRGEDPVVQCVLHAPAPPRPVQQCDENGEPNDRSGGGSACSGEAQPFQQTLQIIPRSFTPWIMSREERPNARH